MHTFVTFNMTVASLPYGNKNFILYLLQTLHNPEAPSGSDSINLVNPQWICSSGHQLISTNPFRVETLILLPAECCDRCHLMCMHALSGGTAASLSEMSLFTVCLIVYASPNDTDPGGTHWRLLRLDINFTQMRLQWAWVHEWMNAHSHTHKATKPQFEPLLEISLSLWLYCHYRSVGDWFENEMSLTLLFACWL